MSDTDGRSTVRIGFSAPEKHGKVVHSVVLAFPAEICRNCKKEMKPSGALWAAGEIPYKTGYNCDECGRHLSVLRDQ